MCEGVLSVVPRSGERPAETPARRAPDADCGTEVALADRVMIGRIPVDLVSPNEFVDLATDWATHGERASIIGVNAYVVNLCAKDPAMAAAVARADLLLPDGHSVVLAAGFNRYRHQGRVAITHMHADMAASWVAAGLRVFLWGSRPGVAAQAAHRLRTEFGRASCRERV